MFLNIKMHSWQEAQRIPHEFINWSFRGQADASWRLSSRIERDAKQFSCDSKFLPWCEARILNDFQRRAHHYLSSPPKKRELLEWLAMIQHHGGPTRLLDFSRSFYVAAFFAMEGAAQDAAVWGINELVLIDTLLKKIGKDEMARTSQTINQRFTGIAEMLLRECATDRFVQRKTKERLVLIVEPERLSERLAIQQGLFLFPCDIRTTFEKNLSETFDFSSDLFEKDDVKSIDELANTEIEKVAVVKLVLPRQFHAYALRDLQRMNVTAATLFPGLDGFARSLSLNIRPIEGK
jgi:hypothetical protein